jgi:predicted DsbA family dithiol-disulfide isomerase
MGIAIAFAVAMVLSPIATAQSDETLAIVDGVSISEAEVRVLAIDELERIETRRLQFEATIRAEEHAILEEALKGMIADRLLSAEAGSRGVSVDELLAMEVAANTPAATEDEVQNVYNLNREQLTGVAAEVGMGQVRDFLGRQNYDTALETYIENLREAHGVESLLGPYRFSIETEGHPAIGSLDAPVTIVEFSDFECPFCRRAEPVFKQIQEEYGDQVRLVYRQFPLNDIHPRAQKAAEASLCADQQGQFWSMHDALFLEPVELEVASLKAKAATAGLDTEAFNECIDSGEQAARVSADVRAGVLAGVTGTPTAFINGRPVSGAQPYETYAGIIDDELEMDSQQQ